jgi:hypothetical protein
MGVQWAGNILSSVDKIVYKEDGVWNIAWCYCVRAWCTQNELHLDSKLLCCSV